MSLSKPLFFHLKSLTPLRRPSTLLSAARRLSFATPEEAAAERRRRKRQLRIEPPLSTFRRSQPPQQRQPRSPTANPNAPKIPEPATALAGKRLDLHNRILALIRENDLDEAALLVRHSIYSNCRPTVFTCNAVLNAQLRQCRYGDLLSLHRFITQASVAPTVVTYNLLLQTYCDVRKPETALEHYRLLTKDDAPISPSPTTYRILAKGLVDTGNLEQALDLKNEMLTPDPFVYDVIMSGFVKSDDPDRVISLYEELKEKLGGGTIDNGAVYGNLMKSYFMKGMDKEAVDVYNLVMGEGSIVRFTAVSYNSVLEALTKHGKLDEAVGLFDRLMRQHEPPRRVTVNLGSFNVMVDGYCAAGRFEDVIAVFRRMSEKKCKPDAISYNNLINQLGRNRLVAEAEEIYREMAENGVSPDEYTHVLLVEACFEADRVEDATRYFRKMMEAGLRPTAAAYNKVIGGLVNVGQVDEADGFFDTMVEKEVKPNIMSYELLLHAFVEAGRLDDALKKVRGVIMDDLSLSQEMCDLVEEAMKKEGRGELGKLVEEIEREKAEAAALAAEEKARAEALAAAEEERKKAEEAAKKEAAAKASKAALEAILQQNKLAKKKGSEDGALAVEAGASEEESLTEDKKDSHSVEEVELENGDASEQDLSMDMQDSSPQVESYNEDDGGGTPEISGLDDLWHEMSLAMECSKDAT